MLLRCAPDAAHVELEATEVDAVVGAALERLSANGDERARAELAAAPTFRRLTIVMASLGQALRVPVKIRGGCCDRQGVLHTGNGLSSLLATLSGRVDQPYRARHTLGELARAREAGELVRSPRLETVAWVETRRDGSQVARRRRFLRSTLYASAPALRSWYRRASLESFVHELGKVVPSAWRRAAYLVRGSRGYWGAIRRSRVEVTAERTRSAAATRRRDAWNRYKNRTWRGSQTSKTERENSSRGTVELPAGEALTVAAGAGRGGGRVVRPPWASSDEPASTPEQGSFRARMLAAGLDVAAWGSDASSRGLRQSLDRGADLREPGARARERGGLPWRAARYRE